MLTLLRFLYLSNKSQKQFRFKDGYSSLTKKIAKHNKIEIIPLKKINKNISKTCCVFNTEIVKIKKSKYDNVWIVTYGKTKVNSIEQINNNVTKIKKIKVKNIYYTGSTKILTRIYDFNNEYQNYFKNSFIPINAVKIYLRFSEDWMTNNGIGLGKSVSTLSGCQIIHYAEKYVLFSIFGSQSNVLHNKIPSLKQIQKKLIKPTIETYPLLEECIKILKKTFNITEFPEVTDLAWATWIEPVKIHAARNLQSLDDSDTVFTMTNKVMFPFGRSGNFYIMSNENDPNFFDPLKTLYNLKLYSDIPLLKEMKIRDNYALYAVECFILDFANIRISTFNTINSPKQYLPHLNTNYFHHHLDNTRGLQ